MPLGDGDYDRNPGKKGGINEGINCSAVAQETKWPRLERFQANLHLFFSSVRPFDLSFSATLPIILAFVGVLLPSPGAFGSLPGERAANLSYSTTYLVS